MKIYFIQDYHSVQLLNLVQDVWHDPEAMLVVAPPHLRDFGFVASLPPGEMFGFPQTDQAARVDPWKDRPRPKLALFTSGTSTGRPRLVYYSRENVLSSLRALWSWFAEVEISTIFCYPQPFHTFGLCLGYLWSIEKNLDLVFAPGRYSSHSHELRVALEDSATMTLGTPVHFSDLASFVKTQSAVLNPTVTAIVGGARVRADQFAEMISVLKIKMPTIGYGSTEAAPALTHTRPGERCTGDGDVGLVLPHLQNFEAGPDGVRFSGPGAALAVWEDNRLDFRSEYLLADSLEHRADGGYTFRGRLDLVLNRGGQKFSLEQIERVLQEKFGAPVLCTRVADSRLGEELGVWLTDAKEPSGLESKARAFLRKELGCGFETMKLLVDNNPPVNAAGKFDRAAAGRILGASHGS